MPSEADGGYIPPTSPMQKDKYGLDLEEFKEKSGHAPPNWHKSVRQASAVIIDDMRTLLEIHYDDVHVERWRQTHGHDEGRPPQRKGAYKVFESVVHSRRKKLNQGVALPESVTDIFQRPEDELSLHKLDKLRKATYKVVEGERDVILANKDDIEKVASAVEASESNSPKRAQLNQSECK